MVLFDRIYIENWTIYFYSAGFPLKPELNSFGDDVIKWRPFPRYWPFVQGIHRSRVNDPHKGQWHGTLVFSLICAWINRWVSNGEAGDLRRHRAHYDVTVMFDGRISIENWTILFIRQSAYWLCGCMHVMICWDHVIKWKHFPRYWPFVQFPSQRPWRPVTLLSFDVFYDLCLNKRLSKQSRHRWFETPSRILWRHCNYSNICWLHCFPSDITVTSWWVRWRLKSPASPLFTQRLIGADQKKKNIKAPRNRPLCYR